MMTDLRLRALFLVLSGACVQATVGCASRSAPLVHPGPMKDTVSIGYDNQSRRNVTGAVTSLDSAALGTARVSRVEDLLRGRVSGLEVFRRDDGSMSIRIRGASSFNANSEPLFVVDGVPLRSRDVIGGALDGLSPSDVQRIDVLKDAAATAIYGVDGANGVILITTRRP